MILYKFYGYEAGLKALKSSQLGFREPEYFNDPFELSYYDCIEGDSERIEITATRIKNIKNSVAILSLTKNPLNPLMWAHYSKDHTGFVIGYNVDTPFLMSEKYNLISVDKGDVIYVSSKKTHLSTRDFAERMHEVHLRSKSIPNSDEVDPEQVKMHAKRLFLTKFLPWAYEEEVRVVKSIEAYIQDSNHNYESFNAWTYDESVKGLKLYSHKCQIKEVYLGARNELLNKCTGEPRLNRSISHEAEQKEWKVFKVSVNKESWELKAEVTSVNILNVVSLSQGY